jgi:hypothetical protein
MVPPVTDPCSKSITIAAEAGIASNDIARKPTSSVIQLFIVFPP